MRWGTGKQAKEGNTPVGIRRCFLRCVGIWGVKFCSVGVEIATFTSKRTTDYAGCLPGRLDFSLKLWSGRSVLVGVLCRRGVGVGARCLKGGLVKYFQKLCYSRQSYYPSSSHSDQVIKTAVGWILGRNEFAVYKSLPLSHLLSDEEVLENLAGYGFGPVPIQIWQAL